MMEMDFTQYIQQGYRCDGGYIVLGAAMQGEQVLPEAAIKLPLKTLNRHGLIAGATGTGKTKTVQLMAELLSEQGIPVLLMDLKGDLSGLFMSGIDSEAISQRHKQLGIEFEPQGFPVELLSISKAVGVRLRATVSEFGPILFSKVLGLSDAQTGIVSLLFKYCDDRQLPLLDLKDFKTCLDFVTHEGKAEIERLYGAISSRSAGTILRKVIELEQQGGELFFGEPSFEVDDLLRMDKQGRGMLSILKLTDMQSSAKLFSTFMLCLLAEIYAKFPETGDLDKPKLVIFIDEAHLVFKQAGDALLEQIENIIRLIRSKGVGIFFCTQTPADIPDQVLGQLGMKVQHALRAFTAKDRKAIKLTAENYPISPFYKTDQLLTQMGVGQAAITVLDEHARPTPLAKTLLRAPQSRMGPLTRAEITQLMQSSYLVPHYNKAVDRESAYEILNQKLEQAADAQQEVTTGAVKPKSKKKDSVGTLTALSKNTLVRQLGRTLMREVTRGLLGVLGVKRR